MLLLLLLLINFHRFSPMVIDFSSISWIFSDGRRFFMNFHRFSLIFIDFQLRSLPPHSFPAEISASPFISSWDPSLPIHFQLGSLPPHSFPAEIPASGSGSCPGPSPGADPRTNPSSGRKMYEKQYEFIGFCRFWRQNATVFAIFSK